METTAASAAKLRLSVNFDDTAAYNDDNADVHEGLDIEDDMTTGQIEAGFSTTSSCLAINRRRLRHHASYSHLKIVPDFHI